MYQGEKGDRKDNVINRLYDLYIVQTKKYLVQDCNGKYSTVNSKKVSGDGNKGMPQLLPYIMERHLEQKHTVGVFSGVAYSKFLCFDVDYKDLEYARWQTYRISHVLDSIGVHNHYISFSGNKGYHIEIFFNELIDLVTAKRFYQFVLKEADIQKCEKGEVEFRPTDKQGVKLPLGIHQVSGNFCGYCEVETGLAVMNLENSGTYLLEIKKISSTIIHNILERNDDVHEFVVSNNKPAETDIIDTEEILTEHRDLPIYFNTEDSIIDSAIELLKNGLQISGTRHNSLFKIGLYLKYLGNDRELTEQMLIDWMNKQNKAFYRSDENECFRDIQEIVSYIYLNDSTIVPKQKEVFVSKGEVDAIIERCKMKNYKLLTYSMLVHAKRFARGDGVFFMTLKQMTEATGLVESTVERNMNKLAEIGVIEIVERNRVQSGTHRKKPNLYRMTLVLENVNELTDSLDSNDSDIKLVDEMKPQTCVMNSTFTTSDDDCSSGIVACFNHYYTQSQLRKLLSRKQFDSFAYVA
ncbi:TOTE conflict system archaeo-eukaryotic primase domain-containing protein [Paenibacillus sp. IHBB 10380]|uniref:TOTE conflict system archaeo-eukaryotic primase domain-containing protein n=1 Tax=Paenibacillus sp. IHBB 10380 TaxID=1566358 RepID=UPI0005CFAD86|nr:hypothetical protein [Paenibacillus sp. IHBB 10380]AJS59999.1 hypothetical protein UB51_17700 [Paenibacillus sp. IHBB 10380]